IHGGSHGESGTRGPPGRNSPFPDAWPRVLSRSRRRSAALACRGRGRSSTISLWCLHGGQAVLRLREVLPLRRSEVGRRDFRFDELHDLRRGGDLLGLHGLIHQVRREPGFELRQAGILRCDREHLLDELQRLIEPTCLREGLHGALEHREPMDRPGIERHRTGNVRALLYALRRVRQYRGISGSIRSAHSSMPPTRFFTFRKPSSRRKFVIRPERAPVLQYTTISSAVLSSLTRLGTCATGMRIALSRRAISHSVGSRTSRRTGGCPASSFSLSSSAEIWNSSPTCSDGPRRPQNSS